MNNDPLPDERDRERGNDTTLAIRTTDLTKRFGDHVAVDHLDLSIPQGHVYGFLGPNGAGKTTTMRMLTTLLPPREGTATIMRTPLTDREAVTRHLGYLPEDPPVYEELTGHDQLSYAAFLHDIPDDVGPERIEDLLARFDMTDDADRRISTYSKGMRQKIGLIQALLHGPRWSSSMSRRAVSIPGPLGRCSTSSENSSRALRGGAHPSRRCSRKPAKSAVNASTSSQSVYS
ncbi:ABC transporter ATP-binding protein [Halobellus sp. H-GB7]|uniref:ATP-binding cassette domain-containing protein n=1 Tax=Halobellus sp. H-GB7 TaxID=3069756 RepID=UPI0027B8037F|nr:ABC transporter ATP-binding protein [Halobellus sp. H-GB7]MDQ2055605.1 ABC transporter ATP-binding protein [Halobellus sp. H-GB7]